MDSFNRWFLDPTKNQYFNFDGRATRQQYWMYVLWVIILAVALSILSAALSLGEVPGDVIFLILLLPQIAFGARRLHDIGKSGWWQLLNFIPIIGWIVVLVWLIRQGETGPNQYGIDPRAVSLEEVTSTVAPVNPHVE